MVYSTMEYGFVIAAIFLALGIGLGVYIGIYKVLYLDPLAEAQMDLLEAMNCDEIVDYTATAYWWSIENRVFAEDSSKACLGDAFVPSGGH